MTLFCCVRGCSNGTEKDLDPTAKFFPFPSVRQGQGSRVEDLTCRRRLGWVTAVKRPSITFEHVSPLSYVCSRHFHKGQPAYETLDTDPDWVPSLHLGHPEPIHQIQPEKSTDIVIQRPKLEIATTSKSKKTSFFVQHECCVVNCDGRSHNDRGQRIRNGLAFYPFPVWRKNDGVFISNLSKRRREAWVTAVGRDHITFDNIPEDAQVCSRHFILGKPAHDMMEKDADWVPSLHLNYKKTPIIKTPAPIKEKPLKKKLNKKVMSKANAAKPRSVPWKDLKSRLQGLMMDKEQPTELPPVVDENDENVQSFEGFFRNALTASLDACLGSGSQSLAEPRPSLDTSWFPGPQKPPLSMPMSLSRKRTSSLSSSTVSEVPCANCVRLQERIAQLEERLATPQYIQDPNTFTQWTQPLHPAESRWGQERPGLEKKSFPPKGRFDTEMLARHWFLRYSPKTNMMWCHVCRFYAPENNRRGGFVAGTRTFQNFTIVQHSKTSFHQECVRRFQARKGRGRK